MGCEQELALFIEGAHGVFDQGFVVFGFPANNFRNQEPGSNSEIRQFCTLNYGINFPLFSKISVKGEDMHPLYANLTSKVSNPEFGGEIQWNFTKFLIGRKGQVIARFEPNTVPDSPEVLAAIEAALNDKLAKPLPSVLTVKLSSV